MPEYFDYPELHAQRSVTDETDDAIVTPAYTREALRQMGMQRSFGGPARYRERFAKAFVDAWIGRFEALTGKAVL